MNSDNFNNRFNPDNEIPIETLCSYCKIYNKCDYKGKNAIGIEEICIFYEEEE